MANPQKQNGFIGIANEIWDQILRRSFTKRQKDILDLLLRLSYGCGRKAALVPKSKDFGLCGVRENHIKEAIEDLITCGIIFKGTTKGEYLFNKNYSEWSVPVVTNWDDERFRRLIHLNLIEAKKERRELPESGSYESEDDQEKLPETGSSVGSENFPKQEDLCGDQPSQNGNVSQKNFPFQEEKKEDKHMGKIPEKGSSEKENFPNQEGGLPETGGSTPDFSSNDAGLRLSKKDLNKLKDKESKDLKDKTIVEIVSYLNAATGKSFSPDTKETIKLISGRLKEGRSLEDFKHVIDVKTAEWLNNERMNQFLRPTTLFAQSNFESYVIQKKLRGEGDGQSQGCSQQPGGQQMAQGYRGQGQTQGGRRRFTEDEFDILGIGQSEVRVPDMQGYATKQTDPDN